MGKASSFTRIRGGSVGASVLFLALIGCGSGEPDNTVEDDWQPELPLLHHAHLNSVDPDAAIEWYLRAWPDGEAGEMAGFRAFLADMPLLFNQVETPPPGAWDHTLQRAAPQSAFWHIGGFVNTTDVFERLEDDGLEVLRLRVGPTDAGAVVRSGLTPYGGIRSLAQLDTAATVDAREGGFGYLVGPDGALVELTGSPRTSPSFSHVHLYHEHPQCAANWYVEHMGMALPPRRDPATGDTVPRPLFSDCEGAQRATPGWPSLERAGTVRGPRGTVRHGNGSLSFYPRQCTLERCGDDSPLVPSAGQVLDHVAFSVSDLDRWVRHLVERGVVVGDPYAFGATRAVMIEGPDRLSIELVERVMDEG